MNVLLDTNAYMALMRGERGLLQRLDRVERVLMSAIVVGELEYGFRRGRRYAENRATLDEFLVEPHASASPSSRCSPGAIFVLRQLSAPAPQLLARAR